MFGWLLYGRTASGASGKEVYPQYVGQSVSDITQPIPFSQNSSSTNRAERKGRTLLSTISAAISLSSSFLAGPLIAASTGQTRDYAIQQSCLASRHLKGILSFLQPDPVATPSMQQVTGVFHIFCLSILIFHRSRKTDPYQNTIIILVTLLGISLNLFLGFSDPYMNTIDQLVMILPCLLSLGAIISAGLHTIQLSLRADMSGPDEESRGDRTSKY